MWEEVLGEERGEKEEEENELKIHKPGCSQSEWGVERLH